MVRDEGLPGILNDLKSSLDEVSHVNWPKDIQN